MRSSPIQKIIIEPQGGLGNRMRVIASALKYQKEIPCKLMCFWNENSELNAPFYKLFEKIEGLKIKSKPQEFNWLKSTNQKTHQKKIISKIINKLAGIDYCIKQQDIKELFWSRKTDLLSLGRNFRNIYIQTCEEFMENDEEYQRFKPISELQEKINEECQKFDHTIGIHIRRTDNIQSVHNSPTELFIERMKTERDKNKSVTFFLSTDDSNVESELIHLFGEHIITRKKILTRYTVEGIQDALIDMFCLANTEIIYGSYWTSFGEAASRIGGKSYVTLKKDDFGYPGE